MNWSQIVQRDVAYLQRMVQEKKIESAVKLADAATMVAHYHELVRRFGTHAEAARYPLPSVTVWTKAQALREGTPDPREAMLAFACLVRDVVADACGGDNAEYGRAVPLESMVETFEWPDGLFVAGQVREHDNPGDDLIEGPIEVGQRFVSTQDEDVKIVVTALGNIDGEDGVIYLMNGIRGAVEDRYFRKFYRREESW